MGSVRVPPCPRCGCIMRLLLCKHYPPSQCQALIKEAFESALFMAWRTADTGEKGLSSLAECDGPACEMCKVAGRLSSRLCNAQKTPGLWWEACPGVGGVVSGACVGRRIGWLPTPTVGTGCKIHVISSLTASHGVTAVHAFVAGAAAERDLAADIAWGCVARGLERFHCDRKG